MNINPIRLHLIFLTGLLIFCAPVFAQAPMFGWYQPVNIEATWVYENVDDPFDTYTESVFQLFEYEGHPAYKMGRAEDDYIILYSFRGEISVYGVFHSGELHDPDHDIVLGEVVDGMAFSDCFEIVTCDTTMIRVWDELDPTLRSLYGMDEGLDMILFVAYDVGYEPNLHNTIVESNLPAGVIPPTGAVTGLDWYLRGIGTIDLVEVDAETGGIVEHYELVEVSPVGDSPSADLRLHQSHPNPFNPATTISFELPQAGPVTLRIYDARGLMVRNLLADEVFPSGHNQAVWRGRDDAGQPVAAGVYYSQLVTESGRDTRPMMLVK